MLFELVFFFFFHDDSVSSVDASNCGSDQTEGHDSYDSSQDYDSDENDDHASTGEADPG